MWKTAVALVSVVTLAACASGKPIDPRITEVTAGVTSEKTSFDVHRKFQGPAHELTGIDGYALVRSWQDADRPRAEHQLYVQVKHDGREKEFLSASEPGGKLVEIKSIDTGELCAETSSGENCIRHEDVGVWLKTADLKRAVRNGGLTIRLNAKRGDDVVVRLPSWYIKGYLAALD
ncbi:hypothetical protein [Parvularcula sp. IMCC14364]|uniref:hypothetical protein n=1 Tax=Parvularcula sp. IMCC14364 TaxID=3067902 RepID=UPI00274059A7|nr:hypothetical protein [Parvularcula sp. IMCC14364]